MPRKVVVYSLLSLDGVAEHPDEFIDTWDDVLDQNLAEVISTQDAVILGRQMYDEWSGYWPTSDMQPFAPFINGVAKYVATSSPLKREWTNSSVIEGDVVTFVRDLKQQPGGDIGVHGSIATAQSLLAGGIVDELRLIVAPTVVGNKRRLLDGCAPVRLEMLGGLTSPTGHQVLHYAVTTS
jgi:dihydrofolate reductase